MELAELEAKVRKAFSEIMHPQYNKNLMELNMMGDVKLEANEAEVQIKTPDEVKEFRPELEARVRRKLKDLPLDLKLKIEFVYDLELNQEVSRSRLENIKYILAVSSGKGGVGKSTVAANLAAALQSAGMKVGLVDTDVYGPSVGKMFGVPSDVQIEMVRKDIIKPVEVNGVKLMSFSFFVHPHQAVVWRGPLLNNAVHQLLFEISWGELDFLIVDMPPGTGDIQISLSQLSNLSGAVVVSTPQSMAVQDAERAVAMFREVNVPILGIVENMAEYICPHCGGVSHIFSHDGNKHLTERYGVPVLGSIPLQTEIMQSGEDGKPIVWKEPEGPVAKSYKDIVVKLQEELKKYE